MSQEKDKVFFRNFSLVVGALAVLMVIFIIAARIFGIDDEAVIESQSAAVSERTAPIGSVSVAGEADTEEAPAVAEATDAGSSADEGKKIFDGLCAACHSSGIPGIPQLGDKDAWAPRIEQGMETLYSHSINGFTGNSGMMMPPRGGGDLGDDEVKAAVDYIISQSQ
jgi:cytochrome c5